MTKICESQTTQRATDSLRRVRSVRVRRAREAWTDAAASAKEIWRKTIAFAAAAVEKDPEQMNEMIGGKNRRTSRSRSPSHYKVIIADDKKVSLIARTPGAIPFMLLTIASRQMFTAHVAADRRGDGVFAVMSLGNWTAQEPNKTTE